MKLRSLIIFGMTLLILPSCFSKKEEAPAPQEKVVKVLTSKAEDVPNKDKSLEILIRYLAEADGIHREAWWVLTAARPPIGKSPFGKVQRAFLSSQNIKLTNKSLFRCDRYLVKRDILGILSYPQKGEVFEKCSEKSEAKLIASFDVPKEGELNLIFYPENLQEVLGLGASILNRQIQCSLKGKEKLESLSCKDWSQDRSKEQMIRLDVYEYHKAGKNMIKLRGKVFENLTDIRKIEADVPMEGKITVIETELYAPEAPPVAPAPAPTSTPVAKPTTPPAAGAPELGLPPARDQIVDPDVMMQRQRGQEPQQEPQQPEEAEQDPSMQGWPEGEGPEQHPQEAQPQDPQQPPVPESQGVPDGR